MSDSACSDCREGNGRGDSALLAGDSWRGGFGGEAVGVVALAMSSEKVLCF